MTSQSFNQKISQTICESHKLPHKLESDLQHIRQNATDLMHLRQSFLSGKLFAEPRAPPLDPLSANLKDALGKDTHSPAPLLPSLVHANGNKSAADSLVLPPSARNRDILQATQPRMLLPQLEPPNQFAAWRSVPADLPPIRMQTAAVTNGSSRTAAGALASQPPFQRNFVGVPVAPHLSSSTAQL